MRIQLSEIYVDDQDAARAFYTDKLGFQVHTDAPYGPDSRWLTVVDPDNPTGTQLLLSVPDDAARTFRDHLRAKGMPSTSFTSDDIQAEYEALVAKGVEFQMPPTKMDYGGTDAVFDDGCGNLLNLHQE